MTMKRQKQIGKKEHWSIRKKNKKNKQRENKPINEISSNHPSTNDSTSNDTSMISNNNNNNNEKAIYHYDSRKEPDIHPGSYAFNYIKEKLKIDPNYVQNAIKPMYPKKRYALLLGYCGSSYNGLQINEGVQTIEAELEKALFLANSISISNYGMLSKIGWTRSGRTDKRVHAACQLISAKLHINEEKANTDFLNHVNNELPTDIKLFAVIPVTKNFCSKKQCDSRTYEYVCPSFLFQPFNNNDKILDDRIISNAPINENEREQYFPQNKINVTKEQIEMVRKYRIEDQIMNKLNDFLHMYAGTHNFHNFTSKLHPTDKKCNRYIMNFIVSNKFIDDNGMEWLILQVHGQSFLLHHIRKMIALAIDVTRGVINKEIIHKAFELTKMDLPKAPGDGLYLARTHFSTYDKKISFNEDRPSLDFSADNYSNIIDDFKRDHIVKKIIKIDQDRNVFLRWLLLLNMIPFTYKALSYEEWSEEKTLQAKNEDRDGKRKLKCEELQQETIK